jgi:magnesium transporter
MDSKEIEADAVKLGGGDYFYVLSVAELSLLDAYPEIKTKITDGQNPFDCVSKYESHDGLDTLHINVPDELQDKDSFKFLGVYIAPDAVICVYEDWDGLYYLPDIVRAGMNRGLTPVKAILSAIDAVTRDDCQLLDEIEDKLTDLEDSLTDNEIESSAQVISTLRRRLRPMKRFYEQLMDTFEDIAGNDNGIFTDTELKYAYRIYGRIDRLYRTVVNLRDYITQVREAYQAQIDIGLNNIMKTFTVITAIFLPLTLLAGWYGMNLILPEFDWQYGYLYVIILSVVIVAACLIFFKLKKWF